MTERDHEIGETNETAFAPAFEGDLPVGTRTPSAIRHRLKGLVPAGIAFFAVIAVWEGAIRLFDVQAFVLPAPSVILAIR